MNNLVLKEFLLNKWNNVATMFEDFRHERSLILLLSLIDEGVLRQFGFTDHEINITKNLAQ